MHSFKFKTGDILLYNTTKYWYSRLIERLTSSDYSHVSMVLHRPTWLDPSLTEEEYYVLESGSERFPDAVSGEFKFGVQVAPFSKVWAEYASQGYGHLYVRRIQLPDSVQQLKLIDGIKAAYAKAKACPYDLNPCDWIKCYFDEHKTLQQIEASSHNHNNQKTTSFWCSAFISFILVVAGVLDKSVPWTVITPYDFSAFCKPQRLMFQGCTYESDSRLC